MPRQRLFVEHYLGESSGSAIDARAGLDIDALKRTGRDC